jgi:6-phosphogluconolactonase/glucosamine-6-phosphate isomerase/deaminase
LVAVHRSERYGVGATLIGMDLDVSEQPAGRAAAAIARRLASAIRVRDAASLALSGGSTAPALIAELVAARLDWSRVTVWQVDERVAPDGHPARNARQLAGWPGPVKLMPVAAADLTRAARRYAGSLPARFDVVHLGLGDDGHTASWAPGDGHVLASERAVEVVPAFNGWTRMTLTPGPVNAARWRCVLAVGAGKRAVVERWLLDDRRLPITSVRRSDTNAFLDFAAAPPV